MSCKTAEEPPRSEAKPSTTATRNCSLPPNGRTSCPPIAPGLHTSIVDDRGSAHEAMEEKEDAYGDRSQAQGCAPTQTGADYNSRESIMRSTCPILVSLALLFLVPLLSKRSSAANAQQIGIATAGKQEQGSHAKSAERTCAACHERIVRSYSETAMALAGGPALEALIPGEFQHQPSGVRYRIYAENGKAWLSFERNGADALKGTREFSRRGREAVPARFCDPERLRLPRVRAPPGPAGQRTVRNGTPFRSTPMPTPP